VAEIDQGLDEGGKATWGGGKATWGGGKATWGGGKAASSLLYLDIISCCCLKQKKGK
jgi:hypothetical protein